MAIPPGREGGGGGSVNAVTHAMGCIYVAEERAGDGRLQEGESLQQARRHLRGGGGGGPRGLLQLAGKPLKGREERGAGEKTCNKF